MLHDYFGFSSEQRAVARQHIVAKDMNLYDMFKLFDDLRKPNMQPTAPLAIGGATSPYPAQRGRAPERENAEVMSIASTLPAPAAPRARASSEPPRFGDIAGVLAQQPLVQLMGPQAAQPPPLSAGSPAQAPSPHSLPCSACTVVPTSCVACSCNSVPMAVSANDILTIIVTFVLAISVPSSLCIAPAPSSSPDARALLSAGSGPPPIGWSINSSLRSTGSSRSLNGLSLSAISTSNPPATAFFLCLRAGSSALGDACGGPGDPEMRVLVEVSLDSSTSCVPFRYFAMNASDSLCSPWSPPSRPARPAHRGLPTRSGPPRFLMHWMAVAVSC